MTVTMLQCLEADEALSALATMAAPPKVAYRIAKLLAQMRTEKKHYEDARVALIKSMGVERDATSDERSRGLAGPILEVPADRVPEFSRQLAELQAMPIELPNAQPLPAACIHELSAVKAETLMALGPFLEEDTAAA